MEQDPADAIAATLRHGRETRKWSLAELAERDEDAAVKSMRHVIEVGKERTRGAVRQP